MFPFILFITIIVATTTAAQLFSNDTIMGNLTTDCENALTAPVTACPTTIRHLRPDVYYGSSALESVCSADCAAALAVFEGSVKNACLGQTYEVSDGVEAGVEAVAGILRYFYTLACLKMENRFCNLVMGEVANLADPDPTYTWSNDTVITNDTYSPCDDCFIANMQAQLNSPYYSDPDLPDIYSAKTSSCSKTGFPVTLTTISANFTDSTPTPAPSTCPGKTYNIQRGDDCHSISLSQNTGTLWLLLDNNLPSYCANFPTNGSLCIQHTCTVHTVTANDSCIPLATSYNATYAQILAWNPQLDLECGNIGRQVGYQICVSSPGMPYEPPPGILATVTGGSTALSAAPVPTNVANATNPKCGKYYEAVLGDYCNLIVLKFGISLSDFVFLNPAIDANCTNLFAGESYCVMPVGSIDDYPGHPGFISATPTSNDVTVVFASLPDATFVPAPTPTDPANRLPIANGTRPDCYYYMDGDLGDTTGNTSVSCFSMAVAYGVSTLDISYWNPSLNASDGNCVLNPAFRYCGQVYAPGQLPPSTVVADAISPTRSGTLDPSNCTQYGWADFRTTCNNMTNDWNITLEEFYAWNSEVGSDCKDFWTEYFYCVGGPSLVPPSTSGNSTAASTTISSGPGAPTQTGQPSNCVKWYVAQSGDSCFSIEQANLISSADFLKWNPSISSDCTSGLWVGYAYCVATSDTNPSPTPTESTTSTTTTAVVAPPGPTQSNSIISTCNKYAISKSGDYCSIFAQENGITTDQLYLWNSVLGSGGANCDTQFWLG